MINLTENERLLLREIFSAIVLKTPKHPWIPDRLELLLQLTPASFMDFEQLKKKVLATQPKGFALRPEEVSDTANRGNRNHEETKEETETD
jgi:hypothetical protein